MCILRPAITTMTTIITRLNLITNMTAASPAFHLTVDKPINPVKFETWIGGLRTNKGQDLLRYKGILDIAGSNQRLAIQGVHMMMEGSDLAPWQSERQTPQPPCLYRPQSR